MKLILTILISLVFIHLEAQQMLSPSVDYSQSHSLKKDVYGCNHLSSRAPFFLNHSGFGRLYDDLGKPLVRYPGGTAANYLNLSTGFFELWDGASAKDSSRVIAQTAALASNGKLETGEDLSAFISFLKQGGKANFVLNVTTMSVTDIKLVFTEICDSGQHIDYLELGNELYNGQYSTVFNDVSDYLLVAKERASLARTYFPNVKVGVVFPSHIYTHESFMDGPVVDDLDRQELWYETLKNDQSFYDALVIHMYSSVGMTGTTKEADFLSYPEAYQHALSHSDAKFDVAYNQLRSNFPDKEYWCTEYHVGGFSGDVRNYRLRYSYLGGFYASTFMLKLLAHPQFTVASWHSMVQWLTYTKNGKTLLPDDYEFGTNVNYAFFSLFKEPILNTTHFTTLVLQGMKNYTGLGEFTGVYKDVEGAVFYNEDTRKAYALIFNKLDNSYALTKAALQASLHGKITNGHVFSPSKKLELQAALQSEEHYSSTAINLDEDTFQLSPYSICSFELTLDDSSAGIDDSQTLAEVNIFPNPTSGDFSIKLPLDSHFTRWEIYSVLGEKIASGSICNLQFDLHLEANDGVYVISFYGACRLYSSVLIVDGRVR